MAISSQNENLTNSFLELSELARCNTELGSQSKIQHFLCHLRTPIN